MTTGVVHGGLRVAIEVHEDVVLVALTGSLDIYTVPGFRRDVDPYAHAGARIVIDLAGVTLIDSSGLGALVSLRNRVQRNGPARLGLFCPQRHLLRVFEMTGLRRAFDFGLPSARLRPGNGGTRPADGEALTRRFGPAHHLP
jgi:anti-sigma B factor antagonist